MQNKKRSTLCAQEDFQASSTITMNSDRILPDVDKEEPLAVTSSVSTLFEVYPKSH